MANYGRISPKVKQGVIAARALGASNREISQRFKVSEATITRTVRDARVEEISREFTSHWRESLIEGAKRAVMDALEDPRHYNRGKIGVSVLKGLGLFQAGSKAGEINNHTQIDLRLLSNEELAALGVKLRQSRELAGVDVEAGLAEVRGEAAAGMGQGSFSRSKL